MVQAGEAGCSGMKPNGHLIKPVTIRNSAYDKIEGEEIEEAKKRQLTIKCH